ncbi:nuclear transport factor 2 family protein [Desulfoferula mesophila]|uniref:DUF4440 domain-containing protein n=1 Tax=Desulfoferula mesophila TaxID=3058419 RepID=A0AAU9EE67_9BACT|nr:hypothetical protein FAK_24870 [Desulfoferula mesophilus]
MPRVACLCVAALLLLAPVAWAEPPVSGEQLVRDLWTTTAGRQWQQKVGEVSPAFMSVQSAGVHDKATELAALDRAVISNYVLSGFRTTRQGPVLVVTYLARVETMKDGRRVGSKTAPRMSVFIKTDQGWQWLAHASVPVP